LIGLPVGGPINGCSSALRAIWANGRATGAPLSMQT